MDEEVSSAFTAQDIQELAAESGYHKRAGGKLSGQLFLELIVFNADSLKESSLEKLTKTVLQKHAIDVSKQAIQDRFNTHSVHFLAKALEKLLNSQFHSPPIVDLCTSFNRILIKDSTCFGLDDSYHKEYPLSDSKDSTKAALRIQFEYDVLVGRIIDLSINPFRDQDNQNWLTTNSRIEENDLIIRDLAYMHLDALKDTIEKRKAKVVCRLDTRTNVYVLKKGKRVKVDFEKEHKMMKKLKLSHKEMMVLVGSESALPMRMVIYTLPDEVVAMRVRKIRKERKRNGSKNIKKETLVRCRLIIMLTNAEKTMIDSKDIYALYGIRWQIELVFKSWKSIAKINKVKKVKLQRLQCFLFGKLIAISMIWHFYWCLNKWWYGKSKKRISMYKAYNYIMEDIYTFKVIMLNHGRKRRKEAYSLTKGLIKFCQLETKKGDIDYVEIIYKTLRRRDGKF